MSLFQQLDWHPDRKRGFAVGSMTFFLGPALGGLVFGLLGDVNHLILAVGGHLSGARVPLYQELIVLIVWPVGTAFAAFLVPVVVESAAAAAVYVGIRVGITGRMTWAETVILAIVCSAFSMYLVAHNDFLSGNWRATVLFMLCTISAAVALRWLAGRLMLVR